MPRYFAEIAYKGTQFNGIASQSVGNVRTVQQCIEEALRNITKTDISTTTSSRTDAGVHALQNYIHFDSDFIFTPKHIYQLNAILQDDVIIKDIFKVSDDAHSRFDALSRSYEYRISLTKNPFEVETSWHYPFTIDHDILKQTASIIKQYSSFESFCKKHADNHTCACTILRSEWTYNAATQMLLYHVSANRFLRGMVRALVATQLQAARGKMTLEEFENIIKAKDNTKANFAAPAKGLFLLQVSFES